MRLPKIPSPPWIVLSLFVLATLGCAAGDVFARPTPTPPPTRIAAPTFTPTPDYIQGIIVVTPPNAGTPGVIVVPPGVDPRSVIPIPETPTATVTPTPTAGSPTATTPPTSEPAVPTVRVEPSIVVVEPIEGVATPTTIAVLIPQPSSTPTSVESPILVPTSAPTVQIATETPIPMATSTSTATATPTIALPTSTPTITPTPFVLVTTGLVSLRTGPGPNYPLIAQLGPNIPVAITGRNPENTWYEICCVNGGPVWVAQTHVQTVNDPSDAPLLLSDAAPTATPTGTATATPTITPTPTATPYGFQIIEGPLYFPSGNEMLTIWAKISAGGGSVPLPGYYVKVLWRNRTDGSSFETRPNTRGEAPSTDTYEFNVPPGPASGNRVEYNYKFEFLPPDPKAEDPDTTLTRASYIDGYWQIYVVDAAGTQLSAPILFDTLAGNTNREVFVAWSLNQ